MDVFKYVSIHVFIVPDNHHSFWPISNPTGAPSMDKTNTNAGQNASI